MANFNITITAYDNQPPVIGDGARSATHGEEVVFTRADFTTNTTPPYSDPEGDLPLNLKVLALPLEGTLKLSGVDVVLNQEISFITDIDAGNFTFVGDIANLGDADINFEFSISDAGSGNFSV